MTEPFPQTKEPMLKHLWAVEHAKEYIPKILRLGKEAVAREIGCSGDVINAMLLHEGHVKRVAPSYLRRRKVVEDKGAKEGILSIGELTSLVALMDRTIEAVSPVRGLFGELFGALIETHDFLVDLAKNKEVIYAQSEKAQALARLVENLKLELRGKDQVINSLRQQNWSHAIATPGEGSLVERL